MNYTINKQFTNGVLEILPYLDVFNISEEFDLPSLILKDNSINLVYKIISSQGYEETTRDKRQDIIKNLEDLFLQFKENWVCQFSYEFKNKNRTKNTSKISENNLLNFLTEEENKLLPTYLDCEILFTVGINSPLHTSPLSSSFSSITKIKYEKAVEELLEIKNIISNFSNNINNIDFILLPVEEIKEKMYYQLNLNEVKDNDLELSSLATNHELINNEYYLKDSRLCIDDNYLSVLDVNVLPKFTVPFKKDNKYNYTYPFLDNILYNLDFPHRVVINFNFLEKNKAIKKLKKLNNYDVMFRLISSFKWLPSFVNSAFSDDNKIEKRDVFISELENETFAVELGIKILIWDKDINELKRKKNMINSGMVSTGQANILERKIDYLHMFNTTLLACPHLDYSKFTVKMSNLLDFINVLDYPKGDKEGILFFNRKFQPYLEDISKYDTNRNEITIGPPGSGKSFSVAVSILKKAMQGGAICIVDLYGTYRKLIQLLGGSVFDISLEKPLPMPPLYLNEGEYEIRDKKESMEFTIELDEKREIVISELQIIMIKEFIYLIIQENEFEVLPEKLLDYILEDVLKIIYKEAISNNTMPNLSDFFKVFKDILNKEEAKERLTKYKSYIFNFEAFLKSKTFNAFFNVKEPTNIGTSKYIYFDLANIQNQENLRKYITTILLGKIEQFLIVRKESFKSLIFDEMWSFVKDKKFLDLLDTLSRTARKRNGATNFVTQSSNDIPSQMLETVAIKNILKHNSLDAILTTAKTLNLNNYQIELLKSLKKSRQFSEMLILKGDDTIIKRIKSDKYLYWTATTDPADTLKLNPLIDKYGGIENTNGVLKAIKEIAQ